MAAKKKPVASTGKASTSANPLTHRAMLVFMSASQWGNRRLDPRISDKTAAEYGAEADMLRTWKRLVGKDAIKVVRSAFSQYRTFYYIHTAPWLDNGYRIIRSDAYLDFVEEERKLRQGCEEAVDDFLKFYPEHREAAKKRLGTAFNDNDYPEIPVLRHKFGIILHFMPIPDSGDFRVDIPGDELAAVRSNIDAQVKVGLENATRDLFERLYKVVVAFRDKLKAYKVNEKATKGKRSVEGAFRSSAVSNVVELCKLLPRLNVAGDPDLDKLAQEVAKSLGKKDAKVLKEDDSARTQAIKQADAMLERMAAYVTA